MASGRTKRRQSWKGAARHHKIAVPRHRVLSRCSAGRCERGAETGTRRQGRQAAQEGLKDWLFPES